MKTKKAKYSIEYNEKGGFRFNWRNLPKVGTEFMHWGEKVKFVGPGMAGMPEVQMANGSTCYALPQDLKLL